MGHWKQTIESFSLQVGTVMYGKCPCSIEDTSFIIQLVFSRQNSFSRCFIEKQNGHYPLRGQDVGKMFVPTHKNVLVIWWWLLPVRWEPQFARARSPVFGATFGSNLPWITQTQRSSVCALAIHQKIMVGSRIYFQFGWNSWYTGLI